MTRTTGDSPVMATFRAQHRGGGLYSEHLSQRAGAAFALAGYRLRLSPTALTLAGLVVGVGSSIALTMLAPFVDTRAGALTAGLAVGLGWQIAYVLDCADGQLARVSGLTSPAGARLDILCDLAVQISVVAAITAWASSHGPKPPAWLYAVFAGTWMVNLVTSVLAHGASSASLVRSGSAVVRVVKLLRDYGAVIAGCALVVAFVPGWTVWLLTVMSIVNGLFLLASIVQAARSALIAGSG